LGRAFGFSIKRGTKSDEGGIRMIRKIALFIKMCAAIVLALALLIPMQRARADMPSTVQNLVEYYASSPGTWTRSADPMNVPDGTGSVSQTANPDGTVTANITSAPGYADSGFFFPIGRLGDLRTILINAMPGSDVYSLNIYFDVNNDGEFFSWSGNVFSGLGGDNYALCPPSVGGVLSIVQSTSCYVIVGANNYTITQLQGGAVAGINANTQIAIWVGISVGSGGSRMTTIQSIAINQLVPVVWVDDGYNTGTCTAAGHTWLVDCFATIQAGVNAVIAWGRVNVGPGTYTENITLNKPLTLHALSGPSATFIDASVTGTPYVVAIYARDVTVDGFDVSSPGYSGGSDASGIFVEPTGPNAHVRITNNIVHDIGTPTRTVVTFGNVGINIGMADGVEIDHNIIYNIIHNCPTAWANGISIWGNDSSTMANNIFVHNNVIHDISSPYPADAGISTQDFIGVVSIFDNSLTNPGEYGLEVRGSTTINAHSNWWGNSNGPAGIGPGTGSAIFGNAIFDPWCSIDCSTADTPIGGGGGTATRSPWSMTVPAATIPNGSIVNVVNLNTSRPPLTTPTPELPRLVEATIQGPLSLLTSFTNPLRICYHYSLTDLSVGFDPATAVIGTSDVNGTSWTMLTTQAETAFGRICADSSHLSYFEIFYTPTTPTNPPPTVVLPNTGFAPQHVTVLSVQPANKAYADLGDLWLEIPNLGVQMPITGVPQAADGTWDVSWLGSRAGWLAGSAFPTWAGNSILTGHVYDADGKPGPFMHLGQLRWGDQVVVHAGDAQYVYVVRTVRQVRPDDTAEMMKHQELPWVTLMTCRGYDEASHSYKYRVLVRAILVEVK
jgi:LPXTG-site transpeptidase (sortase) family protein